MPTRSGSPLTFNTLKTEDSPACERLREAGAVFVGKTTTPAYGCKG